MTLDVIDTFSGIGGFAVGLETAGMRTVAFCEKEPIRRHLLAHHWPGVPIYDDIKTLTGKRLEHDGIRQLGIICGGFPCQDISFAGDGAGLDGERSGLFFELARLIREVGPDFVILENVAALLVRGLEPFSENWPRSGSICGGTAFRLRPLSPLTAETASGLLPTPEASNTKASAMRSGGRSPRNFMATPTRKANQMAPSMRKHRGVRAMFPTPNGMTPDGLTHGPSGNELGRGGEPLRFPTPRRTDGSHGGRVTPSKARDGGNLIEHGGR